MPNDAKLGLVLGVALVLLVAGVFFRKGMSTAGEPAATVNATGRPSLTKTPSSPSRTDILTRTDPAVPAANLPPGLPPLPPDLK